MEAYRDWRGLSGTSRLTDYGFHVAITWWDESVHRDMGNVSYRKGSNSFKHFMAYKRNAIMCDDETLVKPVAHWNWAPCPPCMPKNGELVYLLQQEVAKWASPARKVTRRHARQWWKREAPIVRSAIADVLGVLIYIVHVSCQESADAIERPCAGQRVYGEAGRPSAIDDSVYRDPDFTKAAAHVMSPPFRAKPHQDALWRRPAIRQLVHHRHRSLHLLCSRRSRRQRRTSPRSRNGCGGVEERMAVIWDAGVNTGRLTPSGICCHHLSEHRRCSTSTRVKALSPSVRMPIWWCGTQPACKTLCRPKRTTIPKMTSTSLKGAPCRHSHQHRQPRDLVGQRRSAGAQAGAGRYNQTPRLCAAETSLPTRYALKRWPLPPSNADRHHKF